MLFLFAQGAVVEATFGQTPLAPHDSSIVKRLEAVERRLAASESREVVLQTQLEALQKVHAPILTDARFECSTNLQYRSGGGFSVSKDTLVAYAVTEKLGEVDIWRQARNLSTGWSLGIIYCQPLLFDDAGKLIGVRK
jgi:hypothetical protein